jgi:aspartate racemase
MSDPGPSVPPGAPRLDGRTAAVLGVVGGIAPESTVTYYRLLVAGLRARFPGHYPRIVINSIDLSRLLALAGAGDRPGLTAFLLAEVERLAEAGAGLAFFASNTPHLVFDDVQARSPIPLVSIVEATAARTGSLGLARVGLLGTRFTMESAFYPTVLGARQIAVHLPEGPDRDLVHRVYMTELVEGVFRPETREALLGVICRLQARSGVEAVILGGTELPLILGPNAGSPVPLLDTTAIHVDEIILRLLVI